VDEALGLLGLQASSRCVDRTVIELDQEIRALVASIEPRYPAKAITADVRVGALRVVADLNLLRDALERVIDNAMKFSDDSGTVEITAEMTESPRGGAWVTISIRDEGIGIAPEDLGKTFQLLTLSHSYENHTRGWGLGLAIAKEAVRQHGGTIEIWSAGRGKGCCVTIDLPTAVVEEPVAVSPSPASTTTP
jgi:signal transduction histidine kinase